MKTTTRLMMPYLEQITAEKQSRKDRINERVTRWVDDKIYDRETAIEKEAAIASFNRSVKSYKKNVSGKK